MSGRDRALAPLTRKIMGLIGRCVLTAIDDAPQVQALQISVLDDEIHDGVERFGEYGLTSVPHPGAEGLAVFVGGVRSHGVVVAVEDRRYRLKGLETGEVALYDDLGQVVHLKRDGILVSSSLKVEIAAPQVTVTADAVDVTAGAVTVTCDNVQLGGAGGKKVALDGDPVVAGKVVASSTKVKAL